MEPLALFMPQFVWFLVVWSVVAYLVAWAWSLQLPADSRLLFLGRPTDVPRPWSGPACPESLARNLA